MAFGRITKIYLPRLDSVAVCVSLSPLAAGSGSVSDLLQKHFVVSYIFLDASLAPPTPLLSVAPSRQVGARAPRSCGLQQRVLLTVRTSLGGSLPLRSVGGFQHHSNTAVIRWAVSTLLTKAFIAASCHGVIRRFVGHRWRVLDPRVSLV